VDAAIRGFFQIFLTTSWITFCPLQCSDTVGWATGRASGL